MLVLLNALKPRGCWENKGLGFEIWFEFWFTVPHTLLYNKEVLFPENKELFCGLLLLNNEG